MTQPMTTIEDEISRWRGYLHRRQAIHAVDIAELEDHLRGEIAGLGEAGLAADEAFLVAVKRIGDIDALSREFAREHSERLWKQLIAPADAAGADAAAMKERAVALSLAAGAALLIKAPALIGLSIETDGAFYARNLSFFVLPLLTGYFAWKRGPGARTVLALAGGFLFAAVFANAYPFAPAGFTQGLSALHLPIALWLLVGIAYAGGRWSDAGGRMDFIRFSGELFIYFILIALGGVVLTAFMAMIFRAAGVDIEPVFANWVAPCGGVAAVIVASWLVEAKQSVIENMAPVLARLFTPLFAVVLIAFLGVVAWTGQPIDIGRDVLIAFDLLLAAVAGLVLYSLSARDPHAPPDAYDVAQLVLIVSALLADAAALWAIASRIGEFGFTPNRVAALGENVILLANLAGAAWRYAGFLRGRTSFAALERWQTDCLPVYAGWAAVVAIVFPPLFGFM
jgi:hypothetical protein